MAILPTVWNVTQILLDIEQGEAGASEQLLPIVYDELRRLASARLASEKPGQTLQPTALVHEAYLRLVDTERVQTWNSRGHFFGAAAEAMRRILVDRARKKNALKRGGAHRRVVLSDALEVEGPDNATILAVNDAVERLAADEPDVAELVKLHFFAGMTLDETAEALSMSRATTYRKWSYARACLKAALNAEADDSRG